MSDSKANSTAATPAEKIEEDHPLPEAPARSQLVSIRLPVEMLENLKAAATRHNFRGYQPLVKHILKNWLDDREDVMTEDELGPSLDEVVARGPAEAPPVPRTKPQLLKALTESIRRQEEAAARGAQDEVKLLGEEIERIRDELADLEHSSGEF